MSSLLRSLFGGDLEVYSNSNRPLFKIERRIVKEVFVNLTIPDDSSAPTRQETHSFISILADSPSLRENQWVVVADAAGLALRNIDHLIPKYSSDSHSPREIDLYWTRFHGGSQKFGVEAASPGLWAVRAEHLPLVIDRLEKTLNTEHEAKGTEEIWTKVVKDLPLRKRPFETGEVYAPPIGAVDWEVLSSAAFVTVPGWPRIEQLRFLQALYFGTYFGDDTGLMLNILDP